MFQEHWADAGALRVEVSSDAIVLRRIAWRTRSRALLRRRRRRRAGTLDAGPCGSAASSVEVAPVRLAGAEERDEGREHGADHSPPWSSRAPPRHLRQRSRDRAAAGRRTRCPAGARGNAQPCRPPPGSRDQSIRSARRPPAGLCARRGVAGERLGAPDLVDYRWVAPGAYPRLVAATVVHFQDAGGSRPRARHDVAHPPPRSRAYPNWVTRTRRRALACSTSASGSSGLPTNVFAPCSSA